MNLIIPILLSNEQKQLGNDLYKLYREIISEAVKILSTLLKTE